MGTYDDILGGDSPRSSGGSYDDILNPQSEGIAGKAKLALDDLGLKLNTGATVDIPEQALGINSLARKTTPFGILSEAVTPDFIKKARGGVEEQARGLIDSRRQGLTERLSPEQVAADKKQYFSDDASWSNITKDGIAAAPGKVAGLAADGKLFGEGWSDWRKPLGGAAQSLPSTALMMAPTAAVAGTAAKTAAGEAIAAGLGEQAAAKAGVTAAERAAMVAGGLSEGAQGAGSAYEQTRRTVMEMPVDKLNESPFFQQQLAANGGNVADARAKAAESAATASAGGAFWFDALFGALGDRYIGTAAAGKGSRGGAVVRGIAQETPTEFVQSGGEKASENLAIKRFADPSQKIMQDVGEEAVGGAISGGIMGAGMGGAFHRNSPAGAGTASPPAPVAQLPDTGPISRSANIALATDAATTADSVLGVPAEAEQAGEQIAPNSMDTAAAAADPVGAAAIVKQQDEDAASIDMQNRDRSRASSVMQMQKIAHNPDYELASIARDANGAPMVASNDVVQPLALGRKERVTLPDGTKIDVRYAVVEASMLSASHFADGRENPDYGKDGKLVALNNGRTAGLIESYRIGTAGDYRAKFEADTDGHGIPQSPIAGASAPILIRLYDPSTVNPANLGARSNQSSALGFGASEQARSDAAMIDTMDDLRPDEWGDFIASRDFIRRFVSRLPGTEQAGMVDAGGQLSQAGYARIRNAVLAKAYGDSPVLARMVESLDDNLRNVGKALMQAAPDVAKLRQDVNAGALFDADITPDLLAAVEELSRLKDSGRSVSDALAQIGMFGDGISPEAQDLLRFLDQNIRKPRKISEFIQRYAEALRAAGNPNQGSLLGEAQAPAKSDLLNAARGQNNAEAEPTGQPSGNEGAGAEAGQEPGRAQGGSGGTQGNAAANDAVKPDEWRMFPPESGTLGIPRAQMPQVAIRLRPAMLAFLETQGISHHRDDVAADELKPTQAEYSTVKSERAAGLADDRSDASAVLLSSDGYVLDGHHRWIVKAQQHQPINVIRFNAPIDRLMDAVREFSGATVSTGSQELLAKRTRAVENFYDAAGDLAQILSKHTRAAMVPEKTPDLMPTLVKLFDSAFDVVGTDIKRATAWVKERLRAMPELKKVWNKILPETYRKAAMQAVENYDPNKPAPGGQMGLFAAPSGPAQPDLFRAPQAVSVAKKEAEKQPASKISVDGKDYDLDAPNFGMPEAPITLKDGDPLLVETDTKPADSTVEFQGETVTRAAMRQSIEDGYFSAATPAPGSRKPIAYVMGGGGASGKGFVKKHLIKTGRINETGAVSLDPDEVKPDIPEYSAIIAAGDSRAAAVTHEESSGIAKRIKARAIAGRYDIVLDVTLGDQKKGEKYLQELKDAGYEVRLFGVTVNPEMAVIRAMNRAQKTGRYVPISALLHAHKGFNGAFESYANIADEAVLFDNTTDRQEIAHAAGGKLVISNREAYNGVAERSQINERARTLREISGGSAENSRRDERGRVAGSQKEDGLPAGRVGEEAKTRTEGTRDAGSSLRRPGMGDEVGNSQSASEGRKSQEGGLNEHAKPGTRSPEGQESVAVQQPSAQREAERVRAGNGGGNRLAGGEPGTADARAREVGQLAADGSRAKPEDGGRNGQGNRPRRNAGVPAGRDIPVKTGRNYAFGDADLTYEGSWLVKARQNVEALELLKQLEKDGRQATREEQAVLAKFIGWGSSEIANSLFGDKLNKDAVAIASYERAAAGMAGKASIDRYAAGYYDAYQLAVKADPSVRYSEPITRAQLDKGKPDMAAKKWLELRDRIKAALTPDEWKEASRSTQYAHYTSKPIVTAMWDAMARMGFQGGSILEPGAGIGVFPGLMTPAMMNNSVYTGIEFDSITGGILKQLFPDERILVESFIDSNLPTWFYDVAAGNPPFNSTAILADPKYKKFAFALHDYFFAKTIDSVKPGGLVMFVTSRYTMDKLNDKARAYLAERADLVGAIRLPQTAFKKNAGTDVVTDVLFLRKKVDGETFEHAQPWAKSVPMQVGTKSFPVNEYFHAHPEMVLGTPSDKGSMANTPEPQYTVEAIAGDIDALFAKAAQRLPANIYAVERGSTAEANKVREIDFNPKAQKEGNFYVTDAGVLMQREGGVGVRADQHQKNAEVIKDFVGLRDALKQSHYDQLNDGAWEKSLAALQKAYRAFVKKHGQINQFTEMKRVVKATDPDTGVEFDDERSYKRFPLLAKIQDDPDYSLVMALENINDETGAITEGPFLTDRVLGRPLVQEIKTPADALLAVLNDIGHVDIDAIAERLDMDRQDAIDALGTMIYEDPAAGWVMADEFLSGNVKKKLLAAQEAVKSDRRFERNIEALLAVQPAPVPPSDITVSIGMNWIPAETYAQFLHEKTGVKAKVIYNERTGQWAVDPVSGYATLAATQEWGTPRRSADDILLAALTGAPIRITETTKEPGGGTKTVFLADATEAANQKLAQMRAAFGDWIWQDGERADKLVRIYNDTFNTIVPRAFDGKHLTLPGISKRWNVFDHVKRGAWRIIQSGNTYLAHAVGSGKTFQMVISAMEQKRLGLIKKPMMVVPNHMLQQFAREWVDLYPAARLMVADEKNFHTENRRRFVSRVAMSDLDGVIITHSAFKLLDLDPEFKRKMIEQELDYLRAALAEAGGEEGKKSRDPKIKQIESKIEKMEQKLESAMSGAGKDQNVRFDQLGVDMLYVDEAHEFRKLAFTTQRQVKGIDSSGSDRAFDLWMKTRWLEEKKPGRSLVMASGTPVTNTLAELYSVQRFMAPAVLEERGLDEFDAWASMFGQEHTEIEADASGKYAPVTRFSKFVNVPELTQMFREFADVLTSDYLAVLLGDKRPKVMDGSRKIVITPQTNDYRAFKQELAERLAESRAWKPSREEPNNPDPVIKIIGDGRLAAIDMRFIDPALPSDPDSKLNRMADEVIRVFKETANNEYNDKEGNREPNKGATQIVFSDLGFGAGVAENRGFNARAWFEKRLRDAGVPAAQVAFMSDNKKSTAKLKLFKDINAGRVRIVVGSSKNMGTGVNAQQRLIALHHLDTPWYPADLEQREGRIVRQGNKNPIVQLYAYSTKGSYDAVMWQMLASKQRFIDQALSGDSSVRSIDDLSESSQFQIATAMTSDDERAIQLAGLRAEIEKLQRLYRAHEEQRARMKQEYDWAGQTIRINEQKLPEAEQAASKAQDLSGDKFTARADGKAFAVRKEFGETLMARFKAYADKLGEAPVKVGEISGFDITAMGKTGGGHTYQAGLALMLPEPVLLTDSYLADPVGVSLKATNALANMARLPEQMDQKIAEAKAKRNALEARITAPFPMAEMLADKVKEGQDLETAMLSDQHKLTGLEREQQLEDEWQKKTGAITPLFSRRAQTETPKFKAWFGYSKVVDADGRPLRVYHGTTADILAFDPSKTKLGDVVFFTPDPAAASTYATSHPDDRNNEGANVLPVYVSLQNPRVIDVSKGDYYNNTSLEAAMSDGTADGVIVRGEDGNIHVVIAFHPTQIKSAIGNNGQFDGNNPDITFSRGNGAGMALRDLQAVADRIAKGLKNLPRVHVLESPAALSTKDENQKSLRDFIRKAGAWEDVEGATHNGEIYLFASGLADEARAEHVLATHEVTHYGLRGAIGKDLDAALQVVWMNNTAVRKAAAGLKVRNGLKSNIEATEEVLADMRPHDLAKLSGWRRVVKAVRDWLGRIGATKLAARVDAWLKAGLDEQQQADLFVADLVTAARTWVKSGKGRPTMYGTLLADGSLAEDVAAQEKWLTAEARARGYGSIDELAEKNYKAFENLAKLWREKNPADSLLSRSAAVDQTKTPKFITVDGVQRPALNSNGKPIHYTEDGVRNFWRWIDGTNRQRLDGQAGQGNNERGIHQPAERNPVVAKYFFDGRGRPRVFFHGTADSVASFDLEHTNRLDQGWLGRGVYLSGDPELANSYANIKRGAEAPNVMPLYVALHNPLEATLKVKEAFRKRDKAWIDAWTKRVMAAGHDGVVLDLGNDFLEVVAFNQSAVKSATGNAGRFDPANPDIRMSRASSQAANQTAAERADAIISKPAATWRPLDTVARTLTHAVRLDALTSGVYDRVARLLDRYTPENIKAGVVSDYGIPEAVLDQRTAMQGRMRVQLRKSGELIDKLATLTRAESRVAYEWMNNADPQARAYFEAQLPAESVKVMEEVKAMIDALSQEAVTLGQLDPEAFKRNRFEYLRRSYLKHTAELTKGETASRTRAIAILGDQYKGRGMTDTVDMAKFKNVAPEWWGRKLQAGQADKGLKGEKFIRLERRANFGDGVDPLAGMEATGQRGKLMEVAYWPAGEALPAKYSTWDQSGTWEVRDTKGGKLIVWRDFTKQERVAMGEIDEARYAIAKSLHGMIHDVETGRYLEWVATTYGKKPGEAIDGEIVEASERMRDVFKPGEWVQVPETKIPGTSVTKYGLLAGRYLPGPIWNDVRQTVGFRFKPLGETYAAILGAWKTSKTALSPAVHTNNVMANFVMADWHDVTAGHIVKALRIILGASQREGRGAIGRTGNAVSRAGIADAEAAREVINRFLDSGASLGSWVTAELQKDQLEPLLKALENEVGTVGQTMTGQVGAMVAVQKALQLRFPSAWDAFKPTAAGKALTTEAKSLIDLYEAEDQVFRLAAWLRAKEEGAPDAVAGKLARRSFLDYHINAPWIQALRNSALPFISFTYRAVPMMLETAAKKPHKLMKLALVAAAINALGYMLSGGDEDDERRLLPEEKAGRIWGLVPKLIRMPWNDASGSPVFLDIRRFVPVGDIFDTGQNHAAVPLLPFVVPGGPLALVSELVANQSQFTGRPITLETDTPAEQAAKVADHLYKAFAPNIVVLPGTHAFTNVANAGTGRTDSFGREQSVAQAGLSSVGIKVASYPKDVLMLNATREAQGKMMEIDRGITQLKREYQRNGIDGDEFQRRVEAQQEKKRAVVDRLQERMGGN